jgi:hypothetical protein
LEAYRQLTVGSGLGYPKLDWNQVYFPELEPKPEFIFMNRNLRFFIKIKNCPTLVLVLNSRC